VNVQDYMFAIAQQAQTSLRSIIGQSEMDQLLAERESVNRELRRVIDEPTEAPWGIRVERVEVKDVSLPEGMKRSMSRQAEAERERRARIITADGEYQASKRLAAAANVMARDPAALQLRLLQTVVEVAGERNSTLVMPVPVELLRFFDRMTPGAQQPAAERTEPEDLGDAEVAEAEAEIAGVNVPELEEGALPPVPEVDAVTGQVNELLSAATSPDSLTSATPAEGLPSAAEGLPRVDAENLPSAEVPVTPDSEDTASFPVVDPASPNGAADTEAAAPARKPRASTPRKPRTTATARKPRTTGERTSGRQADR
jgi:regulator of protease activity HflC (stomatin/prohibitin superfamily)